MFPTKILEVDVDETIANIPRLVGAFWSNITFKNATDIAYLPMMADLKYVKQLFQKMEMNYKICRADQARYDIAFCLREKAATTGRDSDVFKDVLYMMGAFLLKRTSSEPLANS